MTCTAEAAALTGGAGKWPMYDRYHRSIHVGDRLRVQRCVGPYGQTRQEVTMADNAYEPYCQLGGVSFDYKNGELIGYHRHVDFEHGHETWTEVLGQD